MRTEKIDEKRDRFKNLLFELAVSQKILSSNKEKSKIYQELEQIYYKDNEIEDFRHFYSDIFAVITMIEKDSALGDIEILSQNMEIIRKGYRPVNRDANGELIDIQKQINKLYDHVNLEISRLNHFKKIEGNTEDELRRVSETITEVRNNINKMENAIEKADDMQKEYIAILGIFASIVLAFTGGIAFSTSVLENVGNASIYRIMLIVIVLAIVLINTIYVLTHFITEIIKKGDKVKYPKYMIVLNMVCGICILGIILCWVFNVPKAVELFQSQFYE